MSSLYTQCTVSSSNEEEVKEELSFLRTPNKITSVSEEDPVAKVLFPTPSNKKLTQYTFGVTIPDNFINPAHSKTDFEEFSDLLFKQTDVKTGKPLSISVGMLYRYNQTTMRNNVRKGALYPLTILQTKKSDDDVMRPENIVGVGFLPSNASKPYFLALIDGKDSIPTDAKWELLIKFVELSCATKICFNCQEAMKCLLIRKRSCTCM